MAIFLGADNRCFDEFNKNAGIGFDASTIEALLNTIKLGRGVKSRSSTHTAAPARPCS